MNLINLALSAAILAGSLTANSSTDSFSSSTTSSSSTSTTTTTTTSSTYTSSSLTFSSMRSITSVAALPTQAYSVNMERPKMINQINIQRSGMKHPLVCQDSLLTSLAQQHANDMAAVDSLEHDLPCSSSAYPVQFCSSKKRLAPYGQAAENIASLTGNNGSAYMAMGQFNADAGQFSNMMNPDYLYVGVGMAMNPISGKYYWVQVFSAGNYQGVSCTLEPVVTVLDAYNRTSTTVQPALNLNMAVYPQGITNNNNKNKLYCTMIPFAHGTGSSALPLGQLPYPTITMIPLNSTALMRSQITGIIGAFADALSKANATIVGPSSMKFIPMMQVQSTTTPTISFNTTSISVTSLPNAASMLATFSPTNSAQSSVQSAMSSMMADPSMSSLFADPTMSSAAAQMAQFMMFAASSTTSTSKTSSTATSSTHT